MARMTVSDIEAGVRARQSKDVIDKSVTALELASKVIEHMREENDRLRGEITRLLQQIAGRP